MLAYFHQLLSLLDKNLNVNNKEIDKILRYIYTLLIAKILYINHYDHSLDSQYQTL